MKRFFFGIYSFLLVSIVLTVIGVGYLADLYIAKRYPGVLVRDDQNLSKGTFYIIEQELLKVHEDQFQTVIDRLQPHFGYPLKIHSHDSLQLTEKEKTSLLNHEIILRDDGNIHFQRIGDSDLAISMGPFEYLEFRGTEITFFYIIMALIFGLMILGWAFYFWGRLKKIATATSAFGQGDLSARVDVPRFSSLSSIATDFNRMAAQIERLISSHKQLVNAVSHEIRTPISRIRFGLESLRTAGAQENDQHLSGIRQDVDELEELVSELLSYSRFERMESKMTLQSHPVLPWLKEYMRVAQEIIDIPFEFICRNIDDEKRIPFDSRQLERAIHNLLQNGSRFASGLIQVRLIGKNNSIEITIEDDGPGIKQEYRERVFDPFVRLDSARNRENGGYGLGLSIVREIIRGHNGTITIKDSSLGGAAFIITLPYE